MMYPDYIEKNKPKVIRWEVVVPKRHRLSPLQTYDVVFDEKDMNIRFPKRNTEMPRKRPQMAAGAFCTSPATQVAPHSE